MDKDAAIKLIAQKLADTYADGRGVLGDDCPAEFMVVFRRDAEQLLAAIHQQSRTEK